MAPDGNNERHDGMDNRRSSAYLSQDANEHVPTIGVVADAAAASKIIGLKSLSAGVHRQTK